jgi:simple sugar transport system permease protein
MHDLAPGVRGSGRGLTAQLDRIVTALRGGVANIGGLLLMLAAIAGLFTLLIPASFPRMTTLQAMMFQLPELGLLSLAMAIPLISGGINLAIVATANLAGLLMAWMLTALMPPDAAGTTLGLWLAGALAAGLLLCSVVGLITGWLVAVIGVHPILVTLGTMTLLHGLGIYYTRGRTLSGFPEALLVISNRTISGIPISFVLFGIVTFLAHLLLTRTPLGIRIHMIGSNLEATRYSGVDTRRTLVLVYFISSLLCWLASVVMMARFNSAGADIAQSYLLITVLAAILGDYGGSVS